jgi:hypothetical protein
MDGSGTGSSSSRILLDIDDRYGGYGLIWGDVDTGR